MSDLPRGWEWTTLGEIGVYLNGRGFRRSEWRNDGRPIIRIQNLTGSGESFNYYAGDAEERHTVRDGDLLVSWAATLGVYVWRGPEAVLNQHIFKVKSLINLSFHRYLLDHALSDLKRQTHGSGMVHITKGRFDLTRVPLPPLEEQGRIASVIEEHLSRLDAASVALESIAIKLRILRRVELREAFTLIAPRRPLGEVAQVVSGQTPKGLDGAEAGRVPFFKVGDMNTTEDGVLRESRTMLSERAISGLGIRLRPAGTVVFPKRGGAIATNKKRLLGREAAFDLNTMGVIAGDTLDSGYLRWWFETVDLGSLSDGSNVPQINHGDIASLTIPVPPLDVQQGVTRALEGAELRVGRLLEQVESAARRSRGLRRAVLAAAFSGKLVPQELHHEPATILLQRIRAGRNSSVSSRRVRKVDTP